MKGKDILAMEKRAMKGVAWLDKNIGRKKWAKKIKIHKLDLGDPRTCMIGEVLGNYYKIGLRRNEAAALGFISSDRDIELYGTTNKEDRDIYYSTLTAVWVGLLKRLKIVK